jgi:deoxyribonuclease-4
VNQLKGLIFGTGGSPNSASPRDTVTSLKRLRELGLDAMELEYVRGSFPGEPKAREIALTAEKYGITLTAHGPYYINLNSPEPEKVEKSRQWIYKTAFYGSLSGAVSMTFHSGYYLGNNPDDVYRIIREELIYIRDKLVAEGLSIDLSPELTGAPSEFGNLDEILKMTSETEGIGFCIDWSHLHARTGALNTTKEFESVIFGIKEKLGEAPLRKLHMHLSGIEYGQKGERKHLNLDESDMNYKDLLKVLKNNGVCGIVICESPSLEDDALKLKEFYEKIN